MSTEQAEQIITLLNQLIDFNTKYYIYLKMCLYAVALLFCFYLAFKFYRILVKPILKGLIKINF